MEGTSTNPLSPEIQAQMAEALNIAPQNAGQPAAGTPSATPAPEGTTAPETITPEPQEEIIDAGDYVKNYLREKFGLEDENAVLAKWQQYQQFETNPPTAEHKFANEDAKRWYEYFTAGKEEELAQALNARQQVKALETMNDEQKIKLFIKMQNPLFDQELIDYQFKKDYGFDENAFKDPETGQITDPMAYRFAKVAAQQKMQNDVNRANEFFSTYKSKIELPAIQSQSAPQVDESYEGYKASTAKAQEDYNNIIAPALTALTENQVPLNFAISDPNNQMEFNTSIAVDKVDLDNARKAGLNLSDYLSKTCYDQAGKFLPERLARMILLDQNFDKYAQSLMRQSVNAERQRVIEKESAGGVIKRDFTNPEVVKTELQKKMEMAFAV